MNRQPALHYVIFLLMLASALVVNAQNQTAPPNYRILVGTSEISEDGEQIVIAYTVYNSGGASNVSATVRLINPETTQVIATQTIRPLRANGDTEQGALSVNITAFPAASRQSLWLDVGIGEVEASSSNTSFDNRDTVEFNVPDYTATTEEPPPSAAAAVDEPAAENDSGIITIPGTDIEIDTGDPLDIALVVGIVLATLLIALILMLILRLLFRRSPVFTNWQPPYAVMPHIDPNSSAGQRQQWQQFAQNNLLSLPCQEGVVQARKVLLGMDGFYLSGWRVKALRMTQYDMYGRVAKSQVTATQGQIKRLNNTMRRISTLKPGSLPRRVKPISRALVKQFRKRITKRSAMLPVALDLQLQGTHGEVRILFELHQCQHGRYQQIDSWEPEMTVTGKDIQEVYTFTVFGQTGGESYREFRRRVYADVNQVFVDMLQIPQIPSSEDDIVARPDPAPPTLTPSRNTGSPPTTPNIPPVVTSAETGSQDEVAQQDEATEDET